MNNQDTEHAQLAQKELEEQAQHAGEVVEEIVDTIKALEYDVAQLVVIKHNINRAGERMVELSQELESEKDTKAMLNELSIFNELMSSAINVMGKIV